MMMLQASWPFLSDGLFPPGYVDPGIVSTAIQAMFIFLFGAMTAYLTAPWRWLMSLLPGNRASATDQADDADHADEVSESPAKSKRRAA